VGYSGEEGREGENTSNVQLAVIEWGALLEQCIEQGDKVREGLMLCALTFSRIAFLSPCSCRTRTPAR
jgi:hypothetical protein